MRGVAVTGIGIVTALGAGVEVHRAALHSGRTGLRPLSLFTLEGLAPAPVGEVDPGLLDASLGSRTLALALRAVREALGARELVGEGVLALGTTTGGIAESEQHYLKHRGTEGREDRALLVHHPLGATVDVLASMLGLEGERHTFSTACSSSANAIGYGAMRIEQGAPWALVGGVDALCRTTYTGFHSLRLLSPEPCRPFDRRRRGLSLGEGAAFLLLEPVLSARAQGTLTHGFVAGWGATSDAHHVTAPHPEGRGAMEAMRAALADAGCTPDEVQYVNAHGTATPANDHAEARALAQVFGQQAPLTSSTKGLTGHTLGAAGAVEAVLSLVSLDEGFVPATVGLEEPDAALALHHVPAGGVALRLETVLSNSFGFGGNNAALVFTRGSR